MRVSVLLPLALLALAGVLGRLLWVPTTGAAAPAGIVPPRSPQGARVDALESVPPGRLDPFADSTRTEAVSVAPPEDLADQIPKIAVKAAEERALQTSLSPGVFIEGRVLGEEGRRVANAIVEVTARLQTGRSEAPPGPTSHTDAQGNFLLGPVDPGLHTLVAEHAEQGRGEVPLLRVALPKDGADRLQQDIYIRLGPSIEGWVLTEEGSPIEGAHVHVRPAAGRMTIAPRTIRSDGQGRFSFENLRPGEYRLNARAEGRLPARLPRVRAGRTDVRIELPRSAFVRGRVFDARTLEPVTAFQLETWTADARSVRLGRRSGPTRQVRDPEGAFLVDDLEWGTFVVRIEAQGYAPADSPPFTLRSAQAVPALAILLERAGILQGQVVELRGGAPIEGAQVRAEILSRDGRWLDAGAAASTHADGSFQLAGLREGTLRLHVTHDSHVSLRTEELELELDGAAEPPSFPPIRLQRGAILEGVVRDAEGLPAHGFTLRLSSQDSPHSQRRASVRQGSRYLFEGLPPGAYRLSVLTLEGDDPTRVVREAAGIEVFLAEGARHEQDLQLER